MTCSLLDKYYFWKVEAEIVRQQDAKRGLSSKSEAQDTALRIISLK